jgi:hypothetical protein
VQVYLTGEFSMFLQAFLRSLSWFSPPSLFICSAVHNKCQVWGILSRSFSGQDHSLFLFCQLMDYHVW